MNASDRLIARLEADLEDANRGRAIAEAKAAALESRVARLEAEFAVQSRQLRNHLKRIEHISDWLVGNFGKGRVRR